MNERGGLELEFHQLDAHDLSTLEGPFDIIVFSDTVNDLWDVQAAFEQVRPLCTPGTRLILNFLNLLKWKFANYLASTNLTVRILR